MGGHHQGAGRPADRIAALDCAARRLRVRVRREGTAKTADQLYKLLNYGMRSGERRCVRAGSCA